MKLRLQMMEQELTLLYLVRRLEILTTALKKIAMQKKKECKIFDFMIIFLIFNLNTATIARSIPQG